MSEDTVFQLEYTNPTGETVNLEGGMRGLSEVAALWIGAIVMATYSFVF